MAKGRRLLAKGRWRQPLVLWRRQAQEGREEGEEPRLRHSRWLEAERRRRARARHRRREAERRRQSRRLCSSRRRLRRRDSARGGPRWRTLLLRRPHTKVRRLLLRRLRSLPKRRPHALRWRRLRHGRPLRGRWALAARL